MAKSIKVVLELDDKNFNRGIKSATGEVDKFEGAAKSSGIGLGSLAAGLAAAGSAALGLGSSLKVASDVENLGVTLKLLYGDANLAAEALEIVKDQAAGLSVSLGEIQGGVPSLALVEEKMGGLGNAIKFTAGVAQGFNMSFEEAAVQVQRALTSGINSAELFKDRGVAAFLEFEQGATYTAEQTREVFLKNFDRIIAANKDAANTLSGQYSMVEDAVFQVQEALGTAFGDTIKKLLQEFNAYFSENKETILATARAIGENLGTALRFLVDNMNIIIPLVSAFAAGWAAIKFVAIAQGFMSIRTAVLALNTAILANPIGAIAAAIAAAAVLIVSYWDEIKVAAVKAADMAQIGFKKLEIFFYDKLGPSIGAIIDLFSDLKAVGLAVGAGIKAAFSDLSNPVEAFKKAFSDTMATMESESTSAVDQFAAAAMVAKGELQDLENAAEDTAEGLDTATEAAEAAAEAQETVEKTVNDANKQLEEQVSQWQELNDSVESSTKELKAVDGAYQDFIADLERDIALTGLSNDERERQITLNKAYEAAAKELGVTLSDLSEETKQQIEEQVDALLELKKTKEDEVETAVDGEKEKQKELERTLERINDNSSALIASSERAVERMKEEQEYMRETIGLYGVEKAEAEALYEYDSKAKDRLKQLEIDYQAVMADTSATEAQKQAAKERYDEAKAAYEGEREEIRKTARETAEYQRSFEYGWRSAYAKFSDDATNTALQAERLFMTMANGMSDALYNFAMTGKLSFSDLLQDMKSQIARFLADRITQKFLEFLDELIFGTTAASRAGSSGGTGGSRSSGSGSSGGSGGLWGKAVDFVKDLFGFEDGGYIPGNKLSVVGERGPELFMPSSSGTIIPNFANGGPGGSGVTNITYNISAVDARSFKQLVAQDPEFIYNVTLAGSRRVPQ